MVTPSLFRRVISLQSRFLSIALVGIVRRERSSSARKRRFGPMLRKTDRQ